MHGAAGVQESGALRQWIVVRITLACVMAGGCKKDSASGKKKIVIGMVAKSQSNDVFQAAYTGAKDAAKELGDKYGVEVTIDWRTPAAEDAAKQVEAVEALTRAGVDGITVACTDATTLAPAIDRAVARRQCKRGKPAVRCRRRRPGTTSSSRATG